MIKRTLLFSSPAYLSTKNQQLAISYPDDLVEGKTVPIEDIGLVVLEGRQVTISNALLDKLTRNKTAIVTCDEKHMPISLMLPLHGHTEYSERVHCQINASKPLTRIMQ